MGSFFLLSRNSNARIFFLKQTDYIKQYKITCRGLVLNGQPNIFEPVKHLALEWEAWVYVCEIKTNHFWMRKVCFHEGLSELRGLLIFCCSWISWGQGQIGVLQGWGLPQFVVSEWYRSKHLYEKVFVLIVNPVSIPGSAEMYSMSPSNFAELQYVCVSTWWIRLHA